MINTVDIFPCSHGNGKFTVRFLYGTGEENVIFEEDKDDLVEGCIVHKQAKLETEYQHPLLSQALNLKNMKPYPVHTEFAEFLKYILVQDGWTNIGEQRHTWAGVIQQMIKKKMG